jgi:hypothetical protein
MRRVKLFKWKPIPITSVGRLEKVEQGKEAWFHEFSIDEGSPVAIVEHDSGEVESITVELIQFIRPFKIRKSFLDPLDRLQELYRKNVLDM